MTQITTSIALCTYNGERFLREQLDSLVSQNRRPDEVIVGNDGFFVSVQPIRSLLFDLKEGWAARGKEGGNA